MIHHLASAGHGDGYAIYLLGRWLYHQIGWWSVPVTTAAVALITWVRVYVFPEK